MTLIGSGHREIGTSGHRKGKKPYDLWTRIARIGIGRRKNRRAYCRL